MKTFYLNEMKVGKKYVVYYQPAWNSDVVKENVWKGAIVEKSEIGVFTVASNENDYPAVGTEWTMEDDGTTKFVSLKTWKRLQKGWIMADQLDHEKVYRVMKHSNKNYAEHAWIGAVIDISSYGIRFIQDGMRTESFSIEELIKEKFWFKEVE